MGSGEGTIACPPVGDRIAWVLMDLVFFIDVVPTVWFFVNLKTPVFRAVSSASLKIKLTPVITVIANIGRGMIMC